MSSNCCSVCVEPFNKSTKYKITCGHCEYNACRTCIKTYLIDQSSDIHCMSCKNEWTRKFLFDNIDKNWINKDYKNHCEQILLERELSLLPDTQPFVEKKIRKEDLKKERQEINENIRKLIQRRDNIDDELYSINRPSSSSAVSVRREFIRHCPANDCHGFLSTSLKCGLCQKLSCAHCRELKNDDEQHICDPGILKNIQSMKNNTKPCPVCAVKIFKIEGCSLMFCTPLYGGCGAQFNWNTLRLETGTNHNPHYYEYRRLQNNGVAPRTPGDIICGQILDNHFINSVKNLFSKKIIQVLRRTIEISEYYKPLFQVVGDSKMANLDLRIKYMQKLITVDQMKTLIQRRNKDVQKKKEYDEILSMYVQCMTDLFYRLHDTTRQIADNEWTAEDINNKKNKEYELFWKEIETLRKYSNNYLYDISKIFGSKVYGIEPNFKFNYHGIFKNDDVYYN